MGYVGVPPQSGFITTAKQRVTSSTNNYVDLDHSISSLADVIVWVNFVKQDSTNLSLTTSTRITLGGTLVSSDIVEIAYLGKAVNTQTPSTGSVSVDMLSASGTKSSSTFLAGDNSFKTVSGTTINNNADNRVITGSGTANTLNGEANLTYDGTFLGVGANADQGTGVHIKVSDSGATAWTSANQLIVEKSGDSGITLLNSTSGESFLAYGDSDNNTAGMVSYDHSDNHMELWTGGAERMRIDSYGEIFVNKTANNFNANGGMWTDGGERISLTRDGDEVAVATNFINTSGYPMAFHYSGSTVGTIRSTNNSTSYNTSSDYRLKENEVAISDGIKRLKNLKPYRFNFKNDKDKTVDGFFAHEVSSVVPEAISGEKDAVDENGEIKPQAIDQSKLVPLLTSALQEAITKIETLEARVKTLEDA